MRLAPTPVLAATILAATILAASLVAAAAHEPRKGPNGGPLVDAGKTYHVEMLASGGPELVIVLTDGADRPVPAAGFKAQAILIVGGKVQRFALEPAEGPRLAGKAPVAIPAGTKGAIQLTAPDGATAQAKF